MNYPEQIDTKEKKIDYCESLIRAMKDDEEIFGLVREDREKILGWRLEIRELEE